MLEQRPGVEPAWEGTGHVEEVSGGRDFSRTGQEATPATFLALIYGEVELYGRSMGAHEVLSVACYDDGSFRTVGRLLVSRRGCSDRDGASKLARCTTYGRQVRRRSGVWRLLELPFEQLCLLPRMRRD
jgi:hypothetical protein